MSSLNQGNNPVLTGLRLTRRVWGDSRGWKGLSPAATQCNVLSEWRRVQGEAQKGQVLIRGDSGHQDRNQDHPQRCPSPFPLGPDKSLFSMLKAPEGNSSI